MSAPENNPLGEQWTCLRCGYDLRGATEPEQVRCPECGFSNLRSLHHVALEKRKRRLEKAISVGLLSGSGWFWFGVCLAMLLEGQVFESVMLGFFATLLAVGSAVFFFHYAGERLASIVRYFELVLLASLGWSCSIGFESQFPKLLWLLPHPRTDGWLPLAIACGGALVALGVKMVVGYILPCVFVFALADRYVAKRWTFHDTEDRTES